ncbi:sugar kinase [Streptomyces sp. NPDC097619]|uniref:sugar kinase n=1 Tax=Streptomyces sp. NPDC097619 TaxID=3157228 RepID=UPI00331DF772
MADPDTGGSAEHTPAAPGSAGRASATPGAGTAPVAVCVGESMAVLLPDRPGPLERVDSFRTAVGGAESNVACALAGFGVPSAWVSRIGDDGFGRRLRSAVAAHGVDVSAVQVDPARPTGVYVKESGGSAHPHDLGPGNSRLHYYRSGSAASALSPALLELPEAARILDGARLVHLSGITAALSDDCLELVRALLRERPAGRLVSFDLNWRPALWRDRDPGVLPALLDAADVLLLGADEAEATFGEDDPVRLRRLFPRPRTVVVKDAGHAATVLEHGRTVVTQPALRVAVVEPTGAGDAFAAGFLAGTLRGLDTRSRLRLGHIAAASALTRAGDQGTPPPPGVTAALLAATEEEWARTRVTADGYSSPALAA